MELEMFILLHILALDFHENFYKYYNIKHWCMHTHCL